LFKVRRDSILHCPHAGFTGIPAGRKNGDKKWLISYADVALNGVQRTLYDYSPEIGKNLTIYCYQPQPGYCACVLVPE